MILPVMVLLLAASVPLAGGQLGRLGELRLHAAWMVAGSIGLQLVVTLAPVPNAVGAPLHLVSYALAAGFVLANRRIPGLLLVGAGGGMNLAAIAANGGVMPASARALELSGLQPATDRFVNSGAIESARLWWLGDVFAIPEGWPLANVFSAGDIVLVVGIGFVLHRVCRREHGADTAANGTDDTGADDESRRRARTSGAPGPSAGNTVLPRRS